jgi:hypothetical protein
MRTVGRLPIEPAAWANTRGDRSSRVEEAEPVPFSRSTGAAVAAAVINEEPISKNANTNLKTDRGFIEAFSFRDNTRMSPIAHLVSLILTSEGEERYGEGVLKMPTDERRRLTDDG